MLKKIYLVIFCDTDPVYSQDQGDLFDQESVWDTTIGCIRKLKERTKQFRDCNKNPVRFTWLLRSDIQTLKIWDDWCFPVRRFYHFWNSCIEDGDEIGWHPHLWRFEETAKHWYQEITDTAWIRQCLEGGYREISRLFPIESVRMGWFFHNTHTMNIISDLGVAYDFSGIPGMKSSRGDHNIYNWEGAMTEPYHPSRTNFWREDPEESENLSILEIPMTVYPQPFFLQLLSGHQLASVNIAKSPFFYRSALRWIQGQKDDAVLLTYFHPSDIMEGKGMFTLDNMIRNLHLTLEGAGIDVEVESLTPDSLVRHLITKA